jgi:hypothetical protein
MSGMEDLNATLSAVRFTAAQMRTAVAALQHRPMQSEADVVEHATILADFVQDQRIEPLDVAGIALHARIVAMNRWCAGHDPYGQSNVDAFFVASARAPLVQTEAGRGFEPVAFAELIETIAEMPF